MIPKTVQAYLEEQLRDRLEGLTDLKVEISHKVDTPPVHVFAEFYGDTPDWVQITEQADDYLSERSDPEFVRKLAWFLAWKIKHRRDGKRIVHDEPQFER